MGYLYALLAAVLFGANGSVTKVLVEAGLSPTQITLGRVASTTVIAGAVLLVVNRDAFGISRRRLLFLAALGVTGVALLQSSYTVAVSLLPVGIALLLEYLAVLMIALVALVVFKEKVKARLWVAIGCVLVGLALVAQIWAAELNPLGVIMALVAAASLTIYFVVGEREVGKSSPLGVAFWTMGFASIFWLIFGDWWRLDPTVLGATVPLSGTLAAVVLPLWVPLLWSMLLGSFAPFLLSLLALKHLTATAAGVVASSEVIFAFAVAWLWLREGLGPIQLVGAAVVLVGIVLAQTARADKVVDPDLAILDRATQPLA